MTVTMAMTVIMILEMVVHVAVSMIVFKVVAMVVIEIIEVLTVVVAMHAHNVSTLFIIWICTCKLKFTNCYSVSLDQSFCIPTR